MSMKTQPTGTRMHKAVRVLAPVAALGLLLTGCTASDTPDDGTTLTVWGSRSYYMTDVNVAAWEKLHPDIKLVTEIVDTDDILERMLRAADAGQPLPDIIQDDVFLLQAYVDAGLVIPLDDYVAAFEEDDPETFDEILPIVWEEPTRQGTIYGAAVTANFDILYYNKPWFEEAGIQLPFDTVEDLYKAAVKLKETRPDSIPFAVQALAGEGVTAFKTVLIGTGTPFDGATPDLSAPGAQYTIDFYQRMQKNGLLPPEAIAWGEAESRGAFVNGAGMIIDGFTTAGDFIDVGNFNFNEQWGNTLMPIDDGQGNTGSRPTSARMWSISSGAENPDVAFEFLEFLASPDYLLDQIEAGGAPARNTAALDDPRVTAFYPFFTEELKQGYLASTGIPSALNAGDVEDVLEQLWGEIITGTDQTPQELADKYQPLLDAIE
jgi:ABC-type glycerol-3-phosphate transport system substrate-binding protein